MAKKKESSFEKKIAELEEIVRILDEGEAPLEEMMEKYEQGMKLAKECREFLDKAEQHITEIGKSNTQENLESAGE